jgi:indole-3-glycerol phosphate synthase
VVEAHTRGTRWSGRWRGHHAAGAINNRDLDNFVTTWAFVRLAATVPAEVTLVGRERASARRRSGPLGAAGVDAILVGESLIAQPELREDAAAALVGRRRWTGT